MRHPHVACVVILATVVNLLPGMVHGQLGYSQESTVCVPDPERLNEPREPPGVEPRNIDPVAAVADPLRKTITYECVERPLNEVLEEFSDAVGIPVILDERALTDVGIPLHEPITERVEDEPAYVFLKRPAFSSLGLDANVRDNVVYVTTEEVASEALSSQAFAIGDLLRDGYDAQALMDTVQNCTDSHWGEGVIADVKISNSTMFFYWTSTGHQELSCLLQALRTHGEQTFVFDPAKNVHVRDTLDQVVSISLDEVPLKEFVDVIAQASKLDVRVDTKGIEDVGLSTDEPVGVDLVDRKFSSVLDVALTPLGLVAIPEQGVLLITSAEVADERLKTAAYGIGDLCSTRCDTDQLLGVIEDQVETALVFFGGIVAPRHDVLVVRQSERAHTALLTFLRDYRRCLAQAPAVPTDYSAIETRYYDMPARQASDLLLAIPDLIDPGTWKRVTDPETSEIVTLDPAGTGSILRVAADPVVRRFDRLLVPAPCPDDTTDDDTETSGKSLVIPQGTLIVTHTKLTQLKIARLMERLSHHNFGENDDGQPIGRTGGFGGGLFNTLTP